MSWQTWYYARHNKLDVISREQRSKVRAYQHVSLPSRFRTLTRNRHNNKDSSLTGMSWIFRCSEISGSLQNAWNILRSDIVFVSVFLFVCFILKSFTSWSVTILNRLELPVVCLVSLSLSAVTVCTRLASISTSKSHPHTCTMYMTAPSPHTCCFTSAIPFQSIFTVSDRNCIGSWSRRFCWSHCFDSA